MVSLAFVASNTGKPNAAVFHVPVWAEAIRSWLDDIRCGITLLWIGVGWSKPSSSMAFNSSAFKEKFKKDSLFSDFLKFILKTRINFYKLLGGEYTVVFSDYLFN